MSAANQTELVQAAQARAPEDRPDLARRVNRGTPRQTLLRIIRGEESLDNIPEPPSAIPRKKLPLAVNAMWDRVRYSVAGCPLETRSETACFVCPDIQSAACTLHNTELLELEIAAPIEAPKPKKEEQMSEDLPILTVDEWHETINNADTKEQTALKKQVRSALESRHGLSTTEILTKANNMDKRIELLVELDTKEGLLDGGNKSKGAAKGAAKGASKGAAKGAAKGASKGASKPKSAPAKEETEADEDSGAGAEALGKVRAEIANIQAELAAVDSGLSNSMGELDAKLDQVLRLLRGLVLGNEELNAKELLETLSNEDLNELTDAAMGEAAEEDDDE